MTSAPALPTPQPRPIALSMGLYIGLFIVFTLAALLALESEASGPIFLSAFIGATVAIFWVWSYSDRKTDDRSLRNFIFAGMVVDLLFNFAATKISGGIALQSLSSALIGVGNLGVLMAATGVGLFLGRGLQRPAYLLMAAVAGAIADIVSVYAGPSKHVSVSNFFEFLSFQWGVIGHRGVHPIIGAGDFIFLTLYFFGSRKFGLDDRKTLAAMIFAIAVGFVVTLFIGAVPALPFMSVALLLVHGPALKRQMTLASIEVSKS